MSQFFFDSALRCPVCGATQLQKLPMDKGQQSFYCRECESEIVTPTDQCCVFCAFGSHKCLVSQGWEDLLRRQLKEKMKNKESKTIPKFIPALGYNFLTGLYDTTISLTMPEKKFRKLLIKKLNPQPDEKIFEFGFGTGANLVLATQKSPNSHFHGLDIDPKVSSIAFAKLRDRDICVDLRLYDGGTFPYNDAEFDKAYSCLVFHQLDEVAKLESLKELHRVLKPGSKLIIGDWGKAKTQWMRIAFYTVQLLDGFKTTTANVKGLLPDYIREAGFSDVQETAFINTRIGSFCYYEGIKK